jgi:hypothetical protein
MTHDPIKNATERLDEIRTEIGTLQAEAREIESALAVMRRFTAVPGRAIAPSIQPTAVEQNIEDTFKRAAPGFQMGQAEFEVLAKKAINETGRPMTRTQLLRWLETNGTPLAGMDASKNAGTKLWRARGIFVNIRGAGYWFRDRPCPTVGYPGEPAEAVFQREEDADVPEDDDEDEAA